ncbi:hypothetical protein B0H17DRAFT_560150 [Mycena rosella]|uniref:Uncharacterized protein n=1 Tax=Mycena rosella TaxID=1033263 RepID=A0AAD7FJ07_MYCRO|nr:hypothetical protein B0H17DRAFT_560150 [Mycena rosella]
MVKKSLKKRKASDILESDRRTPPDVGFSTTGRTYGEGPEREWVPLSTSKSEMGVGMRRDVLENHFDHEAWSKAFEPLLDDAIRDFKSMQEAARSQGSMDSGSVDDSECEREDDVIFIDAPGLDESKRLERARQWEETRRQLLQPMHFVRACDYPWPMKPAKNEVIVYDQRYGPNVRGDGSVSPELNERISSASSM